MMKPFKFLILLLGLFFVPVPLYAQNIENPVTMIMQKVIQKMLTNEVVKKKHLNYKKHYLEVKLDDSGKPKKTLTNQVIEVKPPKGDEVIIQEDGEAKNKKKPSDGELEKITEALSKRFDYEMAKPTADCPSCPLISKGGRAYLVINFRANGSVGTGGDDIKEIMNRSAGKLYVDVENLYIQRFESTMTRTYSRAGGIFQLEQADLVLEQGELDTPEGKIIVITSTKASDPSIVINYRYSIVVFGETRGMRSWVYKDYCYVP